MTFPNTRNFNTNVEIPKIGITDSVFRHEEADVTGWSCESEHFDGP